jgi:hypothetical protein
VWPKRNQPHIERSRLATRLRFARRVGSRETDGSVRVVRARSAVASDADEMVNDYDRFFGSDGVGRLECAVGRMTTSNSNPQYLHLNSMSHVRALAKTRPHAGQAIKDCRRDPPPSTSDPLSHRRADGTPLFSFHEQCSMKVSLLYLKRTGGVNQGRRTTLR